MKIGDKCPPIAGLEFIQGESVAVPCPGVVTVLEFWATWCPPCRDAIPHVSALQKSLPGSAVFVGVTDEDPDTALAFVRKTAEMDYRVACSDDQGGGPEGSWVDFLYVFLCIFMLFYAFLCMCWL
eukprot:TRINITY_DN962_c2_g1_i3.p1 TRINITY_DN962_c2_g1~~TRINITY_DN962_c2_g1_i3.p1  ORF type:complete len:125 (-),score=14.63 TRINITY_DN962_c2_g1_i3:89-463(-)